MVAICSNLATCSYLHQTILLNTLAVREITRHFFIRLAKPYLLDPGISIAAFKTKLNNWTGNLRRCNIKINSYPNSTALDSLADTNTLIVRYIGLTLNEFTLSPLPLLLISPRFGIIPSCCRDNITKLLLLSSPTVVSNHGPHSLARCELGRLLISCLAPDLSVHVLSVRSERRESMWNEEIMKGKDADTHQFLPIPLLQV